MMLTSRVTEDGTYTITNSVPICDQSIVSFGWQQYHQQHVSEILVQHNSVLLVDEITLGGVEA
jgi:hypothetical protein